MNKFSISIPAVALAATAPFVQAAQVIATDLIVQGSECVGVDCTSGESFGFDTLRLKENNLRIKFQDTSVSASFPSTDWQLTANDSTNGGANKFSIEDISAGRIPFTIEGSAPSNSLYVDDGGRIGVGTATPAVQMHIVDGNTPTLRLEQDGSSGFTAQTWDVAGNEANFFVRDVTHGSKLSFRIKPSAPESSIHIDADGDVGLSTASPDANLHVVEAAASSAQILLKLTHNGSPQLSLEDTSAGNEWRLRHNSNGFVITRAGASGVAMRLEDSGNVTFAGTVAANGGSATLPDYVFEPTYELMPLDELERFVKTNKHLPNIPSKSDVEQNDGVINMTEMQYRLLEKIEELTLYILEQNDTIDRLETKVAKLEQPE